MWDRIHLFRKLAVLLLSAMFSHLALEPLHIGEERYSALRPYTIQQVTGTVRFHPGFKSNIAFVEVESTAGKIYAACPINTKQIPCNDPPKFFGLLKFDNQGVVTYSRYSRKTLGSGDGKIISINTGKWGMSESIEEMQEHRDQVAPIAFKAALTMVIYFFASLALNFISRKKRT